MTEVEICKVLAEWMDWEILPDTPWGPVGVPPGLRGLDQALVLPQYTQDRNATNELLTALRHLPGPEWHDFQALMNEQYGSIGNCMQAKPREVCAIILKVLGKWKT